jgi:hypothetical protein
VVLAARKRLEELTPMQVSHHAPPVIAEAPAHSALEAAPASEPDTQIDPAAPPALVEPIAAAEPPTTKTRKRRAAATEAAETPANDAPAASARKRRAAATAEAIQEIAEVLADEMPAAKTRKRRTPAANAERTDEIEPVTTEKAS